MDFRDPVRVGVVFREEGVLEPVWFAWNGRKFPIQAVTHRWRSRDGQRRMLHFAVSASQGLYHLVFDPQRLQWELCGSLDETA